mmetsp:Transcript_92768/g.233219  ORF Transcript_92768/g.233219 Transcript_92768/m.233219 type:complete len:235 (+) Transcript_92768:237-941(+)
MQTARSMGNIPKGLRLAGAARSQAHASEGLLHKGRFALLDLCLSRLFLRIDILLQLLANLRGLCIPLRSGCLDLQSNGSLRLLTVSLHRVGSLLARHADLLRVLHLHLVSLAEHVSRFREGLQQLGVAVIHLSSDWAVPESIQRGHHNEERDRHEGERDAKVEHSARMCWQRSCCEEERATSCLKRLLLHLHSCVGSGGTLRWGNKYAASNRQRSPCTHERQGCDKCCRPRTAC